MNPKKNAAPAWVVPHLGRKVRQLKRTEHELRLRIIGLHLQMQNTQRENYTQQLRLEKIAEFWKTQSDRYFNDLIEAHKIIGGLHYYLEQAGVTIPEDLK